MNCPKCAAPQPAGTTTCIACGLVFARYDPQAEARVIAERRRRELDDQRDTRHVKRVAAIAGSLAAVALVAALVWSLRPVPQKYSPPTGLVFTGQAHEYDGPGAELVLTGNEEMPQLVGRIGADGHFRFELPATMELPRIPPALSREVAEAARIDPGGAGERQSRLQMRYAGADAALRRLGAGTGWDDVTLEPRTLNVGRYRIVYIGPGEQGDLFASNSDLRRIALPGEHMLVLVYADRAGTVRGNARTINAFDVEVVNRWELTLQPGWNLVTSEQTANLGRLAYRTGPVPDDLEWYAFDPRTRAVNVPVP